MARRRQDRACVVAPAAVWGCCHLIPMQQLPWVDPLQVCLRSRAGTVVLDVSAGIHPSAQTSFQRALRLADIMFGLVRPEFPDEAADLLAHIRESNTELEANMRTADATAAQEPSHGT